MLRCVLFLWSLVYIISVSGDFDCRREGSSCNGGTCAVDTGRCTGCDLLSPARQGHDCGLITDQIDGGTCGVTQCENGGICYAGGGGVTSCYCNEEYYGTTCTHRRYNAVSDMDRMVINVYPFPGFSGHIYISGLADTSECLFLPIPDPHDPGDEVPDTWEGYYGSFSHIGSACGDAWENSTTRSRQVTIQHKDNYLTGLDIQVTLTTTLDLEGVDVYSATFSVTSNELLTQQNIVRNTFNPVTMATTTLDGAVVSDNPVTVGAVLAFTFSVPANDFAALRLESVVANNSIVGSSSDSITLVDGGCVDRNLLSVIEEEPGPPDPGLKSTIRFKLRTFKFMSSDLLALTFVVKVCIVDSDCLPVSCPPGSRRRRSVDEDETVLNKVIRVLEPRPPTSAESETFKNDYTFTVTITTEATLLAVFTVVLFVLISRKCRRKTTERHTQTETVHMHQRLLK